MSEESALLRLQEVDLDLMRKRSTLGAMPQQKKLRAIAAAKKKLAQQMTQIVGQRKDIETELSDNQKEHARYSDKVAEVRSDVNDRVQNYRQIKDLEAQLTSLAKKVEKLEFNQLEIEERLEKARTAEANAVALGKRLDDEAKAQQESFEADSTELRSQVNVLLAERQQLVAQISEPVLANYEQAVKRFGGLAVESLSSNVPSVCRVKLQAALFQKLVRGPRITQCPYCHRIIVVRDIGTEDIHE